MSLVHDISTSLNCDLAALGHTHSATDIARSGRNVLLSWLVQKCRSHYAYRLLLLGRLINNDGAAISWLDYIIKHRVPSYQVLRWCEHVWTTAHWQNAIRNRSYAIYGPLADNVPGPSRDNYVTMRRKILKKKVQYLDRNQPWES
jgi:hypothetical protein